jgi:acylphosphatase
MTTRAVIIVRGVVQGVGFRIYAQSEANRLGLRGYVRNLPNGAVEIVAEGDADAVERLIEWAKRGPPAAAVEDVDVEHAEPTGEFSDFTIRH